MCNIMLFYKRLGFAFRQTPGADQGLSKEENSQGDSLLVVLRGLCELSLFSRKRRLGNPSTVAQTFEESVCQLLKKHRYSYYLPSKSMKYLPKRNENTQTKDL